MKTETYAKKQKPQTHTKKQNKTQDQKLSKITLIYSSLSFYPSFLPHKCSLLKRVSCLEFCSFLPLCSLEIKGL